MFRKEHFCKCLFMIYRRAPFFEGYKFCEKSKSTFSWKLFLTIKGCHIYDYDQFLHIIMLYFSETIFV